MRNFRKAKAAQVAKSLGTQIAFLNASTESEIEKSFDNLVQPRASALLVLSESFLNSLARRIAELALVHALPTCFSYREQAAAGGLMSYGASISDSFRQSGVYTGRVLKGEKPAELPVLQPTKFEFVINLKTAEALNLEISRNLLLIADEVIE
jgi:putative tryptophan/tyrosine transport system substrate-binding protein